MQLKRFTQFINENNYQLAEAVDGINISSIFPNWGNGFTQRTIKDKLDSANRIGAILDLGDEYYSDRGTGVKTSHRRILARDTKSAQKYGALIDLRPEEFSQFKKEAAAAVSVFAKKHNLRLVRSSVKPVWSLPDDLIRDWRAYQEAELDRLIKQFTANNRL